MVYEGISFNKDHLSKFSRQEFMDEAKSAKWFEGNKNKQAMLEEAYKMIKSKAVQEAPEADATPAPPQTTDIPHTKTED